MIYLYGSPSEGKTVADLEAALRAEIERIQKDGVSEPELKRAKAQLVAGQVYKLDSMFGQAMEIGQIESAGLPYQKLDRMLDKLKKVSAAEVKAVANKYFKDDTLTIGILDPQPLDGKPRRPAVAIRH
jgi:zinc protease